MSGRQVRLRVLFGGCLDDDMIVVACGIDHSVWDSDLELWEEITADWKDRLSPEDGYYEWREATVTLPYEAVAELFEAPDIPGEVDAG